MKNKLYIVLLALMVAMLGLSPTTTVAQTATYNTTLSAAIANATIQTITVASATNMQASTQTQTWNLWVDGELMVIRSISGTTIGVTRAAGSTRARAHPSGSAVYFGPAGGSSGGISSPFTNVDPYPGSTCTASQFAFLPTINTANSTIWDCTNSNWMPREQAVKTNYISGLGATRTLLTRESGSLIDLDRAAGIVITLPAPAEGLYYDFVVSVSVTSNAYKFSTATQGTDFFVGPIISNDSDSSEALVGFSCNGTTHDNVSMNGSTTGGLQGTFYRVKAISSTLWHIEGTDIGSGSVATPCSTT